MRAYQTMGRRILNKLIICIFMLFIVICAYQIMDWKHFYSDKRLKRGIVLSPKNSNTKYDLINFLKSPFPYKILTNTHNKFSQAKQDETVYALFPKKNGFFIEMGAFDGVTYSNTLWLERHHNWTGLLIEANPDLCKAIDKKQRRVWRLCACISETSTAAFIKQGALGRALDTVDNERLKLDLNVIVPCFKLDLILQALKQYHVDYFSLDVEGGEMSVLNSIKRELISKAITVDVWTIEYRVIDKDQKIIVDKSKHNLKLLRKYFSEVGGYAEHSQLSNTPFSEDGMALDIIFINIEAWCKHHPNFPSGAQCKL